MAEVKEKNARNFIGEIVSDKMDKTVVVKVERVKTHPIYGKKYATSKNYKVHDEKNEYKVGDIVMFTECRPMSKDKRWRVVKKVEVKSKK